MEPALSLCLLPGGAEGRQQLCRVPLPRQSSSTRMKILLGFGDEYELWMEQMPAVLFFFFNQIPAQRGKKKTTQPWCKHSSLPVAKLGEQEAQVSLCPRPPHTLMVSNQQGLVTSGHGHRARRPLRTELEMGL